MHHGAQASWTSRHHRPGTQFPELEGTSATWWQGTQVALTAVHYLHHCGDSATLFLCFSSSVAISQPPHSAYLLSMSWFTLCLASCWLWFLNLLGIFILPSIWVIQICFHYQLLVSFPCHQYKFMREKNWWISSNDRPLKGFLPHGSQTGLKIAAPSEFLFQ